jgi:hypothetical protein
VRLAGAVQEEVVASSGRRRSFAGGGHLRERGRHQTRQGGTEQDSKSEDVWGISTLTAKPREATRRSERYRRRRNRRKTAAAGGDVEDEFVAMETSGLNSLHGVNKERKACRLVVEVQLGAACSDGEMVSGGSAVGFSPFACRGRRRGKGGGGARGGWRRG